MTVDDTTTLTERLRQAERIALDNNDALARAVLDLRRRLAEAEKSLAAIVDFSIREGRSAGWHFAEVRQIARDALATLAEGAGEETNE